MKNSIKKNYIYNLIYQVIALLIPLVTTPYISRVLGAENIGIYSYTYSIMTYFCIFCNLGITMYGQREIAYVRDDKKKRSKTFWELVIVKCLSSAIAILVYTIIFTLGETYRVYYLILTLNLLSEMMQVIWFFQGMEEFGKTVLRNLIVRLLCVISIFVFVKDSNDLVIYALIYGISEIIGNISLWAYVPKYVEKVKIKDLQVFRHIVPTISLFIPQIAMQIYSMVDKTMLGSILLNKSEVGYYEQALKIINLMIAIVTSLGTVVVSRVANNYSKGEKDKIEYYMQKTLSFVIFLAMPICFGLVIISKRFVPIFFGTEYNSVIKLLIIGADIILLTGLTNAIGTQYLVATKREKKYTISIFIGVFANILLNFVLIPKLGALGAIITSIVGLMLMLLFQLFVTKSEINYLVILKKSIKIIISSIIMLVIGLILDKVLAYNFINMIVIILISAFIYFVLLLILKEDFIYEIISIAKTNFLKVKQKIVK